MNTNIAPQTVAGSGAANNPIVAPATPAPRKGRKVGSVSFSVVSVADLVKILGASANVPVSRKFLDARGIAGSAQYASAAYAAVAPAPVAPAATPTQPAAAPAVQVATEDFDASATPATQSPTPASN